MLFKRRAASSNKDAVMPETFLCLIHQLEPDNSGKLSVIARLIVVAIGPRRRSRRPARRGAAA
jgi:hypothetical protein